MKISIITATYNSGATLQRTIDSVVSQDYDDIEYIVVDGNSTDNTLDIINSNKQHIATFLSKPDKGIYEALNKGIHLATGDIIGFLNSDDVYYSSNTVSTIVDSFKNKSTDVVYGDLLYQTNEQINNNGKVVRYWHSKKFCSRSLKYGWMPPHPTLYCLKSVYEQYGHYDENLRIASDYDFILRVFQDSKIEKVYIPKILVRMMVGGVSNRSLGNILKKTREDLKIVRRNNIGGIMTILFKNIRKLHQFLRFFDKSYV